MTKEQLTESEKGTLDERRLAIIGKYSTPDFRAEDDDIILYNYGRNIKLMESELCKDSVDELLNSTEDSLKKVEENIEKNKDSFGEEDLILDILQKDLHVKKLAVEKYKHITETDDLDETVQSLSEYSDLEHDRLLSLEQIHDELKLYTPEVWAKKNFTVSSQEYSYALMMHQVSELASSFVEHCITDARMGIDLAQVTALNLKMKGLKINEQESDLLDRVALTPESSNELGDVNKSNHIGVAQGRHNEMWQEGYHRAMERSEVRETLSDLDNIQEKRVRIKLK